MRLAYKNNVSGALSAGTSTLLDSVLATSRSLKIDVTLTLVGVLTTLMRFKIKDLTAFTHTDIEELLLRCFIV